MLARILLVFFLVQLAPSALAEDTLDWKLVSDRNGIQVYMKHTDDSRLKTFKGVTRLNQSDEYSAVALLEDYESYPAWLHLIDGAREIKRDSPLRRWVRFTTQLPWPLRDREAVVEARVVQSVAPEEESMTAYIINAPGTLPANDEYIRFPEIEGFIRATRLSNDEVEVVYQIVLDPGGYIPAWLVNILMRDAPYFTLEKLRRIIKRPEYANQYYDWLEMRGPGRPEDIPPAPSYIYGAPPEAPMIIQPETAD
ncbi:MAG: START domain-containing protein [Alcanivoracaceae bacterium]|nr:START domain-containing protein [Alcanivoracaceae bacterium]